MVGGCTLTLNEELAKWLADVRIQWSGTIEQPLSQFKIYLYAFFGALTLFSSLIFLRLQDELLRMPEKFTEPTAQSEGTSNVVKMLLESQFIWVLIWILLALAPSLGIAWLLSWPKRPYSPARIYLGGLAFSALICLIVMKVLSTTATPTLESNP